VKSVEPPWNAARLREAKDSAEKALYGVGSRGGQRYDRSDSGPPVQGFS